MSARVTLSEILDPKFPERVRREATLLKGREHVARMLRAVAGELTRKRGGLRVELWKLRDHVKRAAADLENLVRVDDEDLRATAAAFPNHPEAPARLKRGDACFYWVVPACPLCGKTHTHGGGPLDGDPRKLLGPRVAHCMTKAPQADGYILVEHAI